MRRLPYALLLVATSARADVYPRATAGIAIAERLGDVGMLHPTGAAIGFEADLQVAPLTFAQVGSSYSQSTAHDAFLDRPLDAHITTVRLVLRHTLVGVAPSDWFASDMFLIGGYAHESIEWDGGPTLHRSGLVAGLGGSLVLRPHDGSIYQVISYGFDVTFARAPDPGKAPVGCSGPCDQSTKLRPYDATLVMELSWHIGG